MTRTAPARRASIPVVRFRIRTRARSSSKTWCTAPSRSRTRELDDLIIARSDGTPTYNFCVVVDDCDMGVTHVIRGDDHLNNTPRQINMLRALGAEPPVYAHVPMILGPDGAKLSKRHGAVSVLQYRDEGYLPEALLNYLVRLGWSHGDQEIFTRDEMIAAVRHPRRQQGGVGAQSGQAAVAEPAAHHAGARPRCSCRYLRRQLAALGIVIDDDARLEGVARAQQERAKTLKEMAENSRFFFGELQGYDEKAAKKNLTAEAVRPLTLVLEKLKALTDWRAAGDSRHRRTWRRRSCSSVWARSRSRSASQ